MPPEPDQIALLLTLGQHFTSDDRVIRVEQLSDDMAAAWKCTYWGYCDACMEREIDESWERSEAGLPLSKMGATLPTRMPDASNGPLHDIEDAVNYVLRHQHGSQADSAAHDHAKDQT